MTRKLSALLESAITTADESQRSKIIETEFPGALHRHLGDAFELEGHSAGQSNMPVDIVGAFPLEGEAQYGLPAWLAYIFSVDRTRVFLSLCIAGAPTASSLDGRLELGEWFWELAGRPDGIKGPLELGGTSSAVRRLAAGNGHVCYGDREAASISKERHGDWRQV